MFPSYSRNTILIATLGTGLCLHFAIWWRKRSHRDRNKRPDTSYKQIPTAWRRVGRLTGISIYPLKAGRYLSLEQAYCDAKGPCEIRSAGSGLSDRPCEITPDDKGLSDRCFMLFDRSGGKYISNLQYGHLVRVQVEVLNECGRHIQFSVHNDSTIPPLVVDMEAIKASPSSVHTITMYEKDRVHTIDCGDEAARWFSRFLLGKEDTNIRLGFDCDEQRKLDGTIYEQYRQLYGSHISNEDMGRFSYLASYMVMNETSVNELNERLRLKGETAVSTHNFRGNLIITTDLPYEEDNWTWLRINQEVILRVMKPCTRCRMTTLDPETGRFHPRNEPLATLRQYRALEGEEARRLEKHSPRLGLYCGLYVRGMVSVGDEVYASTAVEGQ